MAELETLLHRLKPEIHNALINNVDSYPTVCYTLAELDNAMFYDDLPMSTIKNIHLFGDLNMSMVSSWDWKYGDNLFNNFKKNNND